MKPAVAPTLLLLALAAPAVAQQGSGTVDSATAARYTSLLTAVRDSVAIVSARTAEFRRDLATVGDETVRSRAVRLTAACEAARATLQQARPALAQGKVPRERVAMRDSVVQAVRVLEGQLVAECLRGLAPEGAGSRVDSLRAWGPFRTARVDEAVAQFFAARGRFARSIGLSLPR